MPLISHRRRRQPHTKPNKHQAHRCCTRHHPLGRALNACAMFTYHLSTTHSNVTKNPINFLPHHFRLMIFEIKWFRASESLCRVIINHDTVIA